MIDPLTVFLIVAIPDIAIIVGDLVVKKFGTRPDPKK